MLFVNNTTLRIKARMGTAGKYYWKSIKPGERIDLQSYYGFRLGLTEVKEEVEEVKEIKEKPKEEVKEKPISKKEEKVDKDYEKKLSKIKGIGDKTVKDILRVYPTRTALKTALNNNLELPFRDDVVKKIKKKFRK